MSDPNRINLESVVSTSETREEWGAWAIVVGLIFEVVVALAVTLGFENKFVEHWSAVFATSLIAGGVYAEIHFGRKASEAHKTLRQQSDEQTAQANIIAAKANERAEELRFDNLALQAVLAPRSAGIIGFDGPAKADEWFAGLEAFSGTNVLIQSVSDDREANNLAFGIAIALSARGWTASLITDKRSNVGAGHIQEGLSVLYPVGKPWTNKEPNQPWFAWAKAAEALAGALTKARLGVGDIPVSAAGFVENPKFDPLGPRFDPPLDGVYLQVGPRPIGLTLQWLSQRREQTSTPRE